jgi:hypothetical protein
MPENRPTKNRHITDKPALDHCPVDSNNIKGIKTGPILYKMPVMEYRTASMILDTTRIENKRKVDKDYAMKTAQRTHYLSGLKCSGGSCSAGVVEYSGSWSRIG